MESPVERIMKTADRLGIKPSDRILAVRIASQTLQLFYRNSLTRSFIVSTSRRPPSNIVDSLGTPRGLHEIAERIGGGQPSGMVFKSRLPTGRHYSEYAADELVTDDLITSRILWLRGLEPGINAGGNVDTHRRYIYIHGTRHEDKLGTPASAGCVRMANLDIIALYDEVRTGDWVWIGD